MVPFGPSTLPLAIAERVRRIHGLGYDLLIVDSSTANYSSALTATEPSSVIVFPYWETRTSPTIAIPARETYASIWISETPKQRKARLRAERECVLIALARRVPIAPPARVSTRSPSPRAWLRDRFTARATRNRRR